MPARSSTSLSSSRRTGHAYIHTARRICTDGSHLLSHASHRIDGSQVPLISGKKHLSSAHIAQDGKRDGTRHVFVVFNLEAARPRSLSDSACMAGHDRSSRAWPIRIESWEATREASGGEADIASVANLHSSMRTQHAKHQKEKGELPPLHQQLSSIPQRRLASLSVAVLCLHTAVLSHTSRAVSSLPRTAPPLPRRWPPASLTPPRQRQTDCLAPSEEESRRERVRHV